MEGSGDPRVPLLDVADGEVTLGNTHIRYCGKSHAGMSPGVPVKENQDAGLVLTPAGGGHLFVGVFDGHGENGRKVSQFLIERVPKHLTNNGDYKKGKFEDAIRSAAEVSNNELRRQGFDLSTSGSTGCMLLIEEGRMLSGNVGDSRAVRGGAGVAAESLTEDHKPTLPREIQRIRAKGGRVAPLRIDGEDIGPPRVWRKSEQTPGLCMSRSFGDEIGRSVGVICEPDTAWYTINHGDFPEGMYVVLASDGLYEFCENDEVIDIVLKCNNDIELACLKLIERARDLWVENEGEVIDDTTVFVLHIAPAAAAGA